MVEEEKEGLGCLAEDSSEEEEDDTLGLSRARWRLDP